VPGIVEKVDVVSNSVLREPEKLVTCLEGPLASYTGTSHLCLDLHKGSCVHGGHCSPLPTEQIRASEGLAPLTLQGVLGAEMAALLGTLCSQGHLGGWGFFKELSDLSTVPKGCSQADEALVSGSESCFQALADGSVSTGW
jgi:hypothetical protein